MIYVSYFLFLCSVAFMIYATLRFGRAIKTSGVPGWWISGDPGRWWNVPRWIEGKWFRLWWLFGVNVIIGLSVLYGYIHPTGKVSHPELFFVGYLVIGPWVHWFNVRRLYDWSLTQRP